VDVDLDVDLDLDLVVNAVVVAVVSVDETPTAESNLRSAGQSQKLGGTVQTGYIGNKTVRTHG
jgi:hypothetical protein